MIRLLKYSFAFAGLILLMTACNSGGKRPENLAPNAHMVKAEEVIQGSSYTYLRVTDEGNEYWMAVNSFDAKVGNTYYWSSGMPMKSFTSKELNRTFPEIFFVEDFTDQVITGEPKKPGALVSKGRQIAPEQAGIKVAKAPGGITIAELYADKAAFAGKTVKISGRVVKFSSQIMNMNWIHFQDGTKSGESYDLTITTKDSLAVGSEVIFEGVILVDKDFGHGYFYDVIMENGKIVNKL